VAYKLVIFDFDGTLADSAGWLFGVLDQVADRHGFRRTSDAEIAMLRGRDNREIVRHLSAPAWKLPRIAAHMPRRAARDAAYGRAHRGYEMGRGHAPLLPGRP
jgi:phosphoglycolate phosphatase